MVYGVPDGPSHRKVAATEPTRKIVTPDKPINVCVSPVIAPLSSILPGEKVIKLCNRTNGSFKIMLG